MKRFKISFFLIVGLLVIILHSCRSESDNSKRAEAQSLYRESVKMIRQFSDSMSVASDSSRVRELSERFIHDLTALNFKYPSDTDFEISEGENDTLINLTERFVFLKDSMLYSFAHPRIGSDSIPLDSLNNIPS